MWTYFDHHPFIALLELVLVLYVFETTFTNLCRVAVAKYKSPERPWIAVGKKIRTPERDPESHLRPRAYGDPAE